VARASLARRPPGTRRAVTAGRGARRVGGCASRVWTGRGGAVGRGEPGRGPGEPARGSCRATRDPARGRRGRPLSTVAGGGGVRGVVGFLAGALVGLDRRYRSQRAGRSGAMAGGRGRRFCPRGPHRGGTAADPVAVAAADAGGGRAGTVPRRGAGPL